MARRGRNGLSAALVPLYQISPRQIWRYLQTQPASFWLVCIYLFFEYVRPQSIYTELSVFPWTQVSIFLCLGAMVMEGKKFRPATLADGLLLAYCAIVLISSAFAYDPGASAKGFSLFFSWVLIYFLISNIVNTENRFLVFMLSFLLYNLKMSLHATRSWMGAGFGFRRWGATGAPGWFQNSGEFGIEMALFVPLSIVFILALRSHWSRRKLWISLIMPFTAVVGAVASTSRGALLGIGAAVFWMLLKTRYKVRSVVFAGVAVVFVLAILPAEQRLRFEEMGDDDTSQRRLVLWEDGIAITNQYPILGVGFDNWIPYYRSHYNPRGQLPHNIFIEASSELGYLGLLAFIGLIGATLVTNFQTRRVARRMGDRGRFLFFMAHGFDAALWGYLVSGFFVTVLYYPYFWINLAMSVALLTTARNEAKRAMAVRAPARPSAAPAPRLIPASESGPVS